MVPQEATQMPIPSEAAPQTDEPKVRLRRE
jgi:hypothetical protein